MKPYLRLGLKQLGMGDYSDRLINLAERVNQYKVDLIKKTRYKNLRGKRPEKDENEKEKPQGKVSFRNFSNDMSFKLLRRGAPVRQVDLFAKYGSVRTSKYYGVVQATTEAVSVTERYMTKADWGHSTTQSFPIMLGVFRTFLRMLCEKHGTAVVDWDRTTHSHLICAATPTHALAVGFRRHPGTGVEYAVVDLDNTTENLKDTAYRWMLAFRAKFTNDYVGLQINYIDYFEKAAPQRSLARINLDDAIIYVKISSVMRMQNRTLGVDGDKSEMTDVSNNPIVLRQYDIRGNAVGFKNVSQDPVTAPATSKEVANHTTGYIEQFLKDLSVDGKLVSPRDLQYLTGYTKRVVKPGHFVTSVLTYDRKIKLSAFFDIFAEYLQSITAGATNPAVRIPFGVSRCFVAEKFLDTNQTQQPLIGFNCTNTVKVRIVPRHIRIIKDFKNEGLITDDQAQGLVLV